MNKAKKVVLIIISVILALLILFLSVFFILRHIGKIKFHKNDTHISADAIEIQDDDTINYKGENYTLNRNIVSVVFIGVDKGNINNVADAGLNGQADTIFIATVDTSTKEVKIIPISRETLVDVNVYTNDGTYAGVEKEQICLAYAYGDSPESCSENVIKSIQRLLYGINIDSYVTMDLQGIAEFTKILGGIELVCLEDIYYRDKPIYKDTKLTLSGHLALGYIQYRGDDLEAHTRRMLRQKQFLSTLVSTAGNNIMEDFTKIATYYNALFPFFSSNVSLSQITYLATSCLTTNLGDSLQYKVIDGTLAMGEKWVEFVPDEEALIEVVLDTFYIKEG